MIYPKYARIFLTPVLCGFVILYYLFLLRPQFAGEWSMTQGGTTVHANANNNKEYFWAKYTPKYPVRAPAPLPQPIPGSIPAVQHRFPREKAAARKIREARLEAVRGNFTHAWEGYKEHAWMSDEVAPVSGHGLNPFGGWAATLVDTLDTLWIMGFQGEFEKAVAAIADLDFTQSSLEEINLFETTIRYLGGFLGAYDISNHKYPVLLDKAIEVGQMLYAGFDTPNRMPISRWKMNAAARQNLLQEAGNSVLVAEIGSLTLEFTRLSQLSQDDRYYDAIQRIMDVFDAQQNWTNIPGLWPTVVNAKTMDFRSSSMFTIGGMADSLYEYLPKQHTLLGGASQQYQKLYSQALDAMKSHIFFRPMTPTEANVLFPGDVSSDGQTPLSELKTEPRAQHLSCFAGGMVALGAKVFGQPDDLQVAQQLVDGCIWGYENGHLGIMPEIMHMAVCDENQTSQCSWDGKQWQREVEKAFPNDGDYVEAMIRAKNLPRGVSKVDDPRYLLRPEAIESIFVLYRITGDPRLVETAWTMFNTIVQLTTTEIAHAGIRDCMAESPLKIDRMESFWLAETLKYFYLIFTEPDVVSLDEYVLNTEAHPFRRSA